MRGRLIALALGTLFLGTVGDALGQAPPSGSPPGGQPPGATPPQGGTPPGTTPPGGAPQGAMPGRCTPPQAPPVASVLESPSLVHLGVMPASGPGLLSGPCDTLGTHGMPSGAPTPPSALSGGLSADLAHGLPKAEIGRIGTGLGSVR